jgi:hypothetical protein
MKDNPLKGLAGLTRLELATSDVTGRRSNQLNYSPARQERLSPLSPWLTLDVRVTCSARRCDASIQR